MREAVGLVATLLLAACASSSLPASDAPSTATGTAMPSVVALTGPERVAELAPPQRPTPPALEARFRPDLVEDPCTDRDLPAPAVGDPALTILDRSYALSSDYVPEDLVPASQAGLTGASGTKLVRAAMLEDMAAMHAAWRDAGLSMIVESGYRSYGAQAATFDSWVARLGVAEALRRSARPGHSEHQLGTALDLTSPGWSGRFGDWAVESAEGAWMADHGWEYGFVMSYPAGGEAASCFGYEPWHWRWIGREAAAAHRASGLVLREFLVESVDG